MTPSGHHVCTVSGPALSTVKALLGAGLCVGLLIGPTTAQAVPVTTSTESRPSHPASKAPPLTLSPPKLLTQHAKDRVDVAPVQKRVRAGTRAKTRTVVKSAPTTVRAGEDIDITAKLTRRSTGRYQPYQKKKLDLVLLDDSGGHHDLVIASEKTNTKGRVTFELTTYPELVGDTFDFIAGYDGDKHAKASQSDLVSVTVTE